MDDRAAGCEGSQVRRVRIVRIDGGGHLDMKGAEKFTTYLAAEIVKTHAFKRAFGTKPTDPRE